VDAAVRDELDYLLAYAESAARASPPHAEALSGVRHSISGAIQTLISLGLLSRSEADEVRARLRESLGADFGRHRRFSIVKEGDEHATPDADARARSAYTMCLMAPSLTALARLYDTAATETAIAAAIAEEDPEQRERIERACRLGFEDRGREHPTTPEL
jgi:hypothetical protein